MRPIQFHWVSSRRILRIRVFGYSASTTPHKVHFFRELTESMLTRSEFYNRGVAAILSPRNVFLVHSFFSLPIRLNTVPFSGRLYFTDVIYYHTRRTFGPNPLLIPEYSRIAVMNSLMREFGYFSNTFAVRNRSRESLIQLSTRNQLHSAHKPLRVHYQQANHQQKNTRRLSVSIRSPTLSGVDHAADPRSLNGSRIRDPITRTFLVNRPPLGIT